MKCGALPRSEQDRVKMEWNRVFLREMAAYWQPFFQKTEYGSTKDCKIRYVKPIRSMNTFIIQSVWKDTLLQSTSGQVPVKHERLV